MWWEKLLMRPDSFHAKIINNNYLPRFIKFFILLSANWLFHGLLYMEVTEKLFYLLLDGFLFFPLFFFFLNIVNLNLSIFISILIAHTIHWLFNGHIYVLFKNFNLLKIKKNRFIEYTKELQYKARKTQCILAVAIFGSLSRGVLTESSDLDVKIIRRSGIKNGFNACLFVFIERSRAFWNKFPLDIYVVDNYDQILNKSNELPFVLYDPDNIFKQNL